MKTLELKFLLKLLGEESYRANISKLSPDEKTPAAERDKVCRELTKRGYVDHQQEIQRFSITQEGKALLIKKEILNEFLSEQHLIALKACERKSITPGKLKKIASTERPTILQSLAERGFIAIVKDQIREVWLTEAGAAYLRDEYRPDGNATISLNLLNNYLGFLRGFIWEGKSKIQFTHQSASLRSLSSKPSDIEILNLIKDLDKKLGTENYLPIFHLRQKVQASLSRDELDQALYRLQRQDKLDMSSLVESIHYTQAEIQAGIPQDSGGPLFFLMVNE